MTFHIIAVRLINSDGALLRQVCIPQGKIEIDTTAADATAAFAAAFREAKATVDVSVPVTPDHERRVAQAMIKIAALALESKELLALLPRIAAIQMNPCPPIPIAAAVDILERRFDDLTARSVKQMMDDTAMPAARNCGRPKGAALRLH